MTLRAPLGERLNRYLELLGWLTTALWLAANAAESVRGALALAIILSVLLLVALDRVRVAR
jgi:hypothetical protein